MRTEPSVSEKAGLFPKNESTLKVRNPRQLLVFQKQPMLSNLLVNSYIPSHKDTKNQMDLPFKDGLELRPFSRNAQPDGNFSLMYDSRPPGCALKITVVSKRRPRNFLIYQNFNQVTVKSNMQQRCL